MKNTPEVVRLQRKFVNLESQIKLIESALSGLRQEASNLAAAALDAIEAAENNEREEKGNG